MVAEAQDRPAAHVRSQHRGCHDPHPATRDDRVLDFGGGSRESPSERNCLVAWNSRSNVVNQGRIVTSGPWKRALLVPAAVGTVRFPSSTTSAETLGCALILRKPSLAQQIIGYWRDGRVVKWTFSRLFETTSSPGFANVRILRDGRVTKIYRR